MLFGIKEIKLFNLQCINLEINSTHSAFMSKNIRLWFRKVGFFGWIDFFTYCVQISSK